MIWLPANEDSKVMFSVSTSVVPLMVAAEPTLLIWHWLF